MGNFNLTNSILKALFGLFFCVINLLVYSQTVSTVAGNGVAGYVNGVSANAEFNNPNGVIVDSSGNVYVSDRGNNVIRKISSAGIVTTLAGNGIAGFADGLAANAEFNGPCGLAIDTVGNIYVSDITNHRIRKITPTGTVSTYAGNGVQGFADGVATNAQFNAPDRLAFDKQGNLYVADFLNNRIRKITPTGVVSTYAGNGVSAYLDGNASNAEFFRPNGVCVDSLGNVYAVDYRDNHVRKITTTGIVSTIAGNGNIGHVDGVGANAEFNGLADVIIDKQGNLYVTDQDGNYIRKIIPSGVVSTYAGNGVAGFLDGSAANSEFNNPRPIAFDIQGNIYVADFNNNRIRKITQGTLPITLLQFNAQLSKNNCILTWQTATEINTSYFNIQRSDDGIHFNTINKIAAAGNSNNIKSYSYSDDEVIQLNLSKLFYRLVEIDKDGKSEYSSIRSVNVSNIHSLFSVSPNPSKDFINIVSFYNVNAVQVKITDMNGKTLSTTKQDFIAGQQLKISLSHFPSGVLVMTIKSTNSHEQFKIIKD